MENFTPFLWVTGKQHEFENEIAAIARTGIKSFCVESRIHEDFCGTAWWQDFDEILRAAEKYDMTVWILDDKRFPTGNANDGMKKYPSLRQWHIVADQRDVAADGFPIQIHIGADKEDVLLSAVAFPYGKSGLDVKNPIPLTEKADGEWLIVSPPKGLYRICLIYKSRRGGDLEGYIDTLNPRSVDVLIREVYEQFYRRYDKLFGKRIVGFFSDEPRLGDGYTDENLSKLNYYQHNLGILGAAYPYSDEVEKNLRKALPYFRRENFSALWYETENFEEIRCAYMDAVTSAYSEHFSKRLGSWCNAHNVEYAGHVIEDMNAHTHSGCSTGHYFRSQAGQNLSGIDVVLHQIKPYSMKYSHISPTASGYSDPRFFTNTLPMLAVSDAWLDKTKSGSLCEIFGAYGWGESIRDMKWLLDVMLVSGIDHFIPHAFCPDENNDDCPPHFFENEKNPLFQPFAALISYADKILSLTKRHRRPKVGILYHAEAEWSGRAHAPVDGIAEQLNQRQIPFLIVPCESIENADIETLILPQHEYLPPWILHKLDAQKKKIRILNECETDFDRLKTIYHGSCYLKNADTGLRLLDGEVPLLFQTGDCNEKNSFCLCDDGEAFTLYDPMNETKMPIKRNFSLALKAGETKIVLKERCPEISYETPLQLDKTYDFEMSGALPEQEKRGIGSLNAVIPDFSGYVTYSQTILFKKAGNYEWQFDGIGGALELFIDGKSQGFRFIAPAVYQIINVSAGTHLISYRFYNTLANTKKDFFSDFSCIEAFGLLKQPVLRRFSFHE